MWAITGYKISIDELQEDEEQDASSTGSIIVNRFISKSEYKKIMKILEGKN